MVITVGAIFCVLLLLYFGVLFQFKVEKKIKMAKKVAPCPDYWEEVKDVRLVDVIPIMDNSKNTIKNEVTLTKTLCKVPSSTNTNIGNTGNTIYISDGNIKLRNYNYKTNYKRTGDNLPEPSIITPGFYWKAECDGRLDCEDIHVKIWGNNYGSTRYTPSEFYIDFNDNDWHTYNMHKSQKCNLKDWANDRGIIWDGITNMNC
jgi:hypothetical protein